MTNNFHDLITRMANELDEYQRMLLDDCTVTHRLSDEARAAVAQADERPSDEELLGLHEWMADEWAANHDAELPPSQYARAVLARWGSRQPAPPADGEAAKLVAWLRRIGPCNDEESANLLRAAELLQRQLLVPVSVSERLPGDQLCWWFESDEEGEAYGSSWTLLRIRGGVSGYTHWLPAHALPVPEVNE